MTVCVSLEVMARFVHTFLALLLMVSSIGLLTTNEGFCRECDSNLPAAPAEEECDAADEFELAKWSVSKAALTEDRLRAEVQQMLLCCESRFGSSPGAIHSADAVRGPPAR